MKELTTLELLKLNTKGKRLFVYFLIKENEIIYIGKTGGIFNRIREHLKDKDFDNIKYICADNRKELHKLEVHYIREHNPVLNTNCKAPRIKITSKITKIIESNSRTKVKVDKILNINNNYSSKDVAKILNKSTRTIERYRKCRYIS